MKRVTPIDYARPSTSTARRRIGRDVAIGLLMVVGGLPVLAVGLLASIMSSDRTNRAQFGTDPWAGPSPIMGADLVLNGLRRMLWGPPPPM